MSLRKRFLAVPPVLMIAVAAAMWGTDPIIRRSMTASTSSVTIVFGEHVILVTLTLPLLLPALRAAVRAGRRVVLAAIVIGAGSSAIATILFTQALFHGDFVTPVVIQKVQPLVALAAAALLLGERPQRRFASFLVPSLVGFWLVNQPSPLHPSVHGLVPVVEATGAAVLWALGTVLGRYVSCELAFQHVISLRFLFGLIASALALPILGASPTPRGHDSLLVAYLAIVTGLLALSLYYFGLQRTPALLATLAELTYPAIAVLAGIYAYRSDLTWSQWTGAATILATVTLLPAQPRHSVVTVAPRDAVLSAASTLL
jgi:drug/metabolite transporter (DMT)-like permease